MMPPMRRVLCCTLLLGFLFPNPSAPLVAQPSKAAKNTHVSYEKDVRPIFKTHCFQCHGESNIIEGGLDLRLNRFIQKGGDSGPATIAGDHQESLIWQRVSSGEMPPKDNNLSPQEIRILEQWIQLGAKNLNTEPESLDDNPYFTQAELEFWAFQPINKPTLPTINDSTLARSPVDYFILQRLQDANLSPSISANKTTLLRRLTYDLLGLPPTLQQMNRFLTNNSPDAYEQLVDELLMSPRYGERWGRHWLDVAGYADSEGYTDKDIKREWAYYYRDYVVNAFNQNKPYDQFLVEQLAGDELIQSPLSDLQPSDVTRLQATGFLRMAPDGTGQAGVDQMVARNQMIADTINIMTTSILGLTVGCAQCHDHRYDPISQEDYYELRAILAPALDWKKWQAPSTRRISLYTDEDRQQKTEIESHAAVATAKRQQQIDQHLDRTLTEELIRVPNQVRDALRTAYKTKSDQRTDKQKALLEEYPAIGKITSGSLYLYSRKRAARAVELTKIIDEREQQLLAQVREEFLNNLPQEQRTVLAAAQQTKPEQRTSEQNELLKEAPVMLVDYATLSEFKPTAAAAIKTNRQIIEICRTTNSTEQLEALQKQIDEIRAEIPKEHFIRALTEPVDHAPDTVLFIRGNHDTPGDKVSPSELDIFTRFASTKIPLKGVAQQTTNRRLTYAQHLTNGKHPLTARVFVNSVWKHHFGKGIVDSSGDFGVLGQAPTHPVLLDYLASEFMDNNWDIKRLHRLIVTSNTYRQISQRTAVLDEVDPDNKLLARQSIRRLESEAFRDAVLAVSGLLNNKMHGPGVPVMEDGVGQIVLGIEKLDGERINKATGDLGGEEHRRSVYIEVRRTRPLAVLATFDIASNAPNCTKRASSNVAPQSLLVMNSDFMVDYSQAFAAHIIKQSNNSLEDQIRLAWKTTYAERPTVENLQSLLSFMNTQIAQFKSEDTKLDDQAAQRKAFEVLCQALLGSNQFLYID
jgi:mono/diheme cytochrome c family protein